MNNQPDKELTCGDCGKPFTFTAQEQAFFQEKGFSTPKRCPECRRQRKAERRGGGGGHSSRYGNRY